MTSSKDDEDNDPLILMIDTHETVQGLSLTLQGVDDVKRSDSLSLGVFSVGD